MNLDSFLNFFSSFHGRIVCWWNNLIKKDSPSDIEFKQVEVLTLKEVIAFFKESERITLLNNDKNNIAVAVREKASEEQKSIRVSLCIFNSEKEEVSIPLLIFEAKELDENLLKQFGDKDMLVLT